MNEQLASYLDVVPEGEGVAVFGLARKAKVQAAPHGPRLVREGRLVSHRDVVLHFWEFRSNFFFCPYC